MVTLDPADETPEVDEDEAIALELILSTACTSELLEAAAGTVASSVRVDVKVTPTVLATIETTVVVEAFGGDTKPIESKDAAASPIMRPTISRDAPMNAFIYGSIK
jgi:hypothetical protein